MMWGPNKLLRLEYYYYRMRYYSLGSKIIIDHDLTPYNVDDPALVAERANQSIQIQVGLLRQS